jgi:hypothetical protein
MPQGGTVAINITYNSANGYSMSPASPHIDHGGIAQFNATNQNCTICFSPTTTPFGASLDLTTGVNSNISVGDGNYQVSYCITTYGNTCTPPPAFAATPSGTIKVGSGSGVGHGKK